MLIVMYWENDDDEKRKLQREEKLRQKKGLPVKEDKTTPVDKEHLDRVLSLLERQMQVTAEQSKQLNELNASLEDQKKILNIMLTREPTMVREVLPENSREESDSRWDHIDVPVLDADQIEDVGTGAAGEKSMGKDVSSKIAMLKKLKQDKGKE
jgi:hypothetical protein